MNRRRFIQWIPVAGAGALSLGIPDSRSLKKRESGITSAQGGKIYEVICYNNTTLWLRDPETGRKHPLPNVWKNEKGEIVKEEFLPVRSAVILDESNIPRLVPPKS